MEKARLQDFAEPEGGYARFVAQLNVLAKALQLAAGQNEVACLDFHTLFLDDAGHPVEKYFLDDGLHPNQAGHRLMAGIAIEKLSELRD